MCTMVQFLPSFTCVFICSLVLMLIQPRNYYDHIHLLDSRAGIVIP